MSVKKAILDVLRNNDSTINWIHIKSKHSENAIRVILNREMKPNNIVVETNDYKNKYKIYTLNTPKNIFKHVSWIRSRYIHVKWRIYEQERLSFNMQEFTEDSIKSLNGLFKASEEDRKFKKAIKLRDYQRKKFISFNKIFIHFLNTYKYLFEKIDFLYEKWKQTRDDNEINPYINFNQVFQIERDLNAFMDDFKKSEKSHRKFIDNLKHPKF